MKPMKPMPSLDPMKPRHVRDDHWWPADLSSPTSRGAQYGVRYAFFAQQRRLVIERAGRITQYDTGDVAITGVSQKQRDDDSDSPVFDSRQGPVDLASLQEHA